MLAPPPPPSPHTNPPQICRSPYSMISSLIHHCPWLMLYIKSYLFHTVTRPFKTKVLQSLSTSTHTSITTANPCGIWIPEARMVSIKKEAISNEAGGLPIHVRFFPAPFSVGRGCPLAPTHRPERHTTSEEPTDRSTGRVRSLDKESFSRNYRCFCLGACHMTSHQETLWWRYIDPETRLAHCSIVTRFRRQSLVLTFSD